jgi:hypothetical protein
MVLFHLTSTHHTSRLGCSCPEATREEALDEIAAEQEGKHEYLDLPGMLGSTKDHVYSVMVSGAVAQGIDEWSHLEAILAEVHEGRVYRRRRGGRGEGDTT